MKNLQIGRVKTAELVEIAGADEFAVHPILQTLAVSTVKKLILLEDNVIASKISWENERRGVPVISLTFRTDGSQVVAILADGRALIVDDGELMVLEIAEIPSATTTDAEWSGDEQLLAVADSYNLYLADSSLVPFVKRPLLFGELKSAQVNVGWGSEATQFRGSAGKLKPGEKLDKEREDVTQHSEKTSVHWRWDGELVAVSFYSEGIRNMAIFDRNGEVQNLMNIRNIYLSHCFAHKPNANLICSAILQKDSDDKLMFYERNGETRNSLVVKWPRLHENSEVKEKEMRRIERLEWNSTGTILALQISHINGSSQKMEKTSLEFWHLSNYEFTRKLFWQFTDNVIWKWSLADSQIIEVLLSSGQFFSVHLGPAHSFSDALNSQNVVIATDELRMYSLCRRVVPPPMCDHSIQCPSDVVAYSTSSRKVHVILADRRIISYNQCPYDYTFNSDRLSFDAVIPQDQGIICGFVYEESSESYVIWSVNHGKHIISRLIHEERVYEGDDVAWLGVNPVTQKVEFATNSGVFYDLITKEELFKIEKFDSVEVRFTQNHHVILADLSKLFIDSLRVSQDAVSILTRSSDILLIDFENKLRFIDVETGKPTSSEDVRDVEAGCELVACSSESANVILQAARGNLETIQPRRYVMAHTRVLLDNKEYLTAFRWMKKHRVDMSFAMKHRGEDLEKDVEKWLKTSNDSQLLEQLLVSCTEIYDIEGTSLCTTVYKYIKNLEDVERKKTMFPLLLTALLRSKPSRINDALKEIQDYVDKVETRKDVFTRDSLHHISFFVPAKELFNCALSTYDLKLAQQVAEASNYDPKEYLPVLNKLNRVSCLLERQYRINVVREAWTDAIRSLFVLDTSEQRGTEEEWWNDAKDIIQREKLWQNALSIVKPTEKRYKDCCELYALELEKKVQWKEAAMFYELAANCEKTLYCWQMARDVDGLISAARNFEVPETKLKLPAMKMSAALRMSRQPKELAKALKLASSPSYQIVEALCEAFEWTSACRESTNSEKDLNVLKTTANTRLEQIQMDLDRRREEFEKYRKRLQVVRETKLKRVEQFAAGEVEDLRDDISVISSISSRSGGSSKLSMASSVRKRKQIEKKKGSLKEGGEYEDSALLNVLAEHYRWAEQVGDEIPQLRSLLIRIGQFEDSHSLGNVFYEFKTHIIKNKNSIWPDSLPIQCLPGPLYALFDPAQEPSPIPMPPIFRLEPELVAPIITPPTPFL